MGKKIIDVKVEDVEKRRQPNKHYVYVICVTWSDHAVTVIYRRYSQFFSLQNKLLDKFPVEGGDWDPSERIIPFLPGKILFGRSHIRRVALDRLDMISKYCSALVQLPSHIAESKEVLDFFETHPEDIRQHEKEKSPVRQGPVANKISNPLLLEQYVAVDDYTAEGANETSLTAGALVEVVEKAETGWWFVSTEDGRGWVPSSYLETYNGEQEDRILQKANQGHGEKFICCHSYSAQHSDELSMEKGAYVEVLERNLDGWWLVRINEKEGRVPGTFLTRTDTLKAKRLLDLKPQASPKVEIIPNVMAISNLTKKTNAHGGDTIPGAKGLGMVGPGGEKASKPPSYSPRKPPAGQAKPVQVLPVTESTILNLPRGAESSHLSAISNESISSWASWTSSEDSSTAEIGPYRVPPRRDTMEGEARHRTASMSGGGGDCESLYEVHTAYAANIPDGLSVVPGQRLKLLERANNGWWFFQSDTDEGWVPSAYVQQITSPGSKPKTKPQRPPPPKFSRNPQCPPAPDPAILNSDRYYDNIDAIETDTAKSDAAPKPQGSNVNARKPDLPKQDILKANIPKPDIPKPDIPKPDIPKPNIPKPDIPKPDIPKPNLRKPDVPKPEYSAQNHTMGNGKQLNAPENAIKPPKSPKPTLPIKPAGLKPVLPKKPSLPVKPKGVSDL